MFARLLLALALESQAGNYSRKRNFLGGLDSPHARPESAPEVPAYATAEEFGRILRDHRARKHLSQQAIADGLRDLGEGVTASAVGDWERGGSYPSRPKVFALEKVLGLAAGDLTRYLGFMPSNPDEDLELSASGVDLDELRRLDPDAYELIVRQAELALDRARERRQGSG